MFSLIACVGKKRELGKGGELIFHIKEDMKFFKETTMGHKVLMGRKTWESLPGKLPGRENIVVSRHPVEGSDFAVSNLQKFISEHESSDEEIFVIGGGMVYFELLPHAKYLYLTEVDSDYPSADSFFPDFDKSLYSSTLIKKGSENGLGYSIIKYTKT